MNVYNIIPSSGGRLAHAEALELVARVPSGSIALVYLDPPQGTAVESDVGARELQDMLADVVREAFRVLAPTGNLFYTIAQPGSLTADAFDARFVLKQVFGREPLEISRPLAQSNSRSSSPTSKREVTLWVTASDESTYNAIPQLYSDKEIKRRYPLDDEKGQFRLMDLTVPVASPRLRFDWEGVMPPDGRSWRYDQARIEAFAAEGRIVRQSSSLRLKQYAHEMSPPDLPMEWDDIPQSVPPNERVRGAFVPGQKPLAFARRMISLGSNEGDVVLDPFCGTGELLLAAALEGRRWIGSEANPQAIEFAEQRLCESTDLPSIGWVLSGDELASHPIHTIGHAPILTSVGQVKELQQKARLLMDLVHRIQATLKDGGSPEETIGKLEVQIQAFLDANTSGSVLDAYINRTRQWLAEWDALDHLSQKFLPQAEFMLDMLYGIDALDASSDYGPFVIQYCKVLENEILLKLFVAYTEDLQSREDDINAAFASDKDSGNTKHFLQKLSGGLSNYTLGEMYRVMDFIKVPEKSVLNGSPLLQDFKVFADHHFNGHLSDRQYLEKIKIIKDDFRNQAAHPYLIDLEAARACQVAVRSCLGEFLRSYRGTEGEEAQ